MRMRKADRRAQLLKIMHEHHERARTQSDFCADEIAAEAGVSRVRFYVLVGEEFCKLRGRLPGKRRSSRSIIATLRREMKKLRVQIKELHQRYETALREKLAEAVRHIELLDEENRLLRDRVAALEQRLNEGTINISPDSHLLATPTSPQTPVRA